MSRDSRRVSNSLNTCNVQKVLQTVDVGHRNQLPRNIDTALQFVLRSATNVAEFMAGDPTNKDASPEELADTILKWCKLDVKMAEARDAGLLNEDTTLVLAVCANPDRIEREITH